MKTEENSFLNHLKGFYLLSAGLSTVLLSEFYSFSFHHINNEKFLFHSVVLKSLFILGGVSSLLLTVQFERLWIRVFHFSCITLVCSYPLYNGYVDVRYLSWLWCLFLLIPISLRTTLFLKWASFALIFCHCLFYFISGLWKIRILWQALTASELSHLIPNIMVCLAVPVEELIFNSHHTNFWVKYPYAGFSLYGLVVVQQLLAIAVPFFPKTHMWFGLSLVVFHLVGVVFLGLNFFPLPLLNIFLLVNSPFRHQSRIQLP